MKKFLSMLLTGTFLFTAALPGNVFAEDYLTREEVCEIIVDAADDDNPGVAAADVLKGDGEGNTYGDREATKLETFIMLDRAFGTYPELSGANLIMNNTDAVYTDIPDWAKAEMSQVLVAGIADGTDSTTFGVNEKVTETDLEKYLKRVYAVFGTNLKDDFYSAVNGDILNSLSIETGRSGNGRLYEAIDNNWEKLFYVMADCIMGSSEKGSKEDKIKNYYTNYIDMAARNAMTTEVVGEYLDDIENMETIADFQTFNEKIFEDLGVSIINFGATADSMDSNVYIAYFAYPTPNLSKEAYMGENDVFKNAYIKYLNTILTLSGDSEEKAAAETEFYFETESKIALKTFDTSELYDLGKTYNIYTVSELDEIYDELDIQAVYEMSQLTHLDKILVTQPAAMEEAADLFTQERIDDLKNYCRVSMIDYIDGYMGQEYIDAENVYDMESLGTVGSTSVSSDAITSVNNVFSDYIGEMYGDLYCTDEITSEVKEIAEEIVEIYRERIDSADWMSEETKANAKHKLDTITTNIREPERYNDYYA
ncbi:MAG: hypothetical protein LUH47_05475, partial [Clostridiales bacterium]|nr:hypothetical protein [Clostridiales bacterium]